MAWRNSVAGLFKTFALALSLALLACISACADDGWQRVAAVMDGDTFRLENGGRVRVAGIDTPEMHPQEQKGAQASLQRTKQLLRKSGNQVRLEVLAQDRYQRNVAEVWLRSEESLGEILLSEGLAVFYWHSNLPNDFCQRMLSAQRYALKRKAGHWEFMLSLPAAKGRFVGNCNTRRVYPADSSLFQRISPKNRVVFGSLEEALWEGYSPSRESNIWPLQQNSQRGKYPFFR